MHGNLFWFLVLQAVVALFILVGFAVPVIRRGLTRYQWYRKMSGGYWGCFGGTWFSIPYSRYIEDSNRKWLKLYSQTEEYPPKK